MITQNPNSVLFLYEGATEFEFYSKLFKIYLPNRKIRISTANLHGIWSLNKKVRNKMNEYLIERENALQVSVIIAYDREGNRQKEGRLNINLLIKQMAADNKDKRIRSITEVIATQDIESWFFKDIEAIHKFLRVPKKERNDKYKNAESFNNADLSKLFRRYGKHYQKGSSVEGFVDSLNLKKIYDNTPELQDCIVYILKLI